MALITIKIPALDRALHSIGVTFQATAATINRSMNRAMAPMKGIRVSMTEIFRNTGIPLVSISRDPSEHEEY